MRWIWIDKFEHFEVNVAARAIKNVSLAEEHLHDHIPGFPVMPASLMIEGMAQTAGILVGAARNFQEKVILAKIGRASFARLVRPGDQIVYAARIVNVSEQGAAIEGAITVRSSTAGAREELPVGSIDMMFSHIDNNLAGAKFPEFNFVFNSEFMNLFETYRRDLNVQLPAASAADDK
ncbi:MAG TPA: beta-hydroxyacyl-ACP dehydratase [Phycisphaerae bacterium]|jgi:3-hydroxyacyl-[acyl-carrier-protein] dehydratase|nr:beta-hydroxyacyl-ACP dehydratase [Phycisphaerae bacterium]